MKPEIERKRISAKTNKGFQMSAITLSYFNAELARSAEIARLRVISNAKAGYRFSIAAAVFCAVAFVFFAVATALSSGFIAVAFALYMTALCGLGVYVFAADAVDYRETVRKYTARAPRN